MQDWAHIVAYRWQRVDRRKIVLASNHEVSGRIFVLRSTLMLHLHVSDGAFAINKKGRGQPG